MQWFGWPVQIPLWTTSNVLPIPERLRFQCMSEAGWTLPQLSGSSCWAKHIQTWHTRIANGPRQFGKTIMSSKYIKQYVRLNLPRQFCINLWKVVGALCNPKGICSCLKNPRFLTMKAVYCFDVSSMVIWQKPTFRSRQEKISNTNKTLNGLLYVG